MPLSGLARSIALFVAAGLAEVGGGYLVWRWLREGRSVFVGLLGGVLLLLYGVIPTGQSASFGRTYARTADSSSCSRCCGAGGSTAGVPTCRTSSGP